MIPTMLLVGLVIGRRWAVLAGAAGWATTLLVTGTIGADEVPLAAALAAVNVAVGVLVRSGMGWYRKVKRDFAALPED